MALCDDDCDDFHYLVDRECLGTVWQMVGQLGRLVGQLLRTKPGIFPTLFSHLPLTLTELSSQNISKTVLHLQTLAGFLIQFAI